MADFVRTAGDLAHPFTSTLSDNNGPVDLPPGTTVIFTSRLLAATTLTTNASAVVVSPGAPVGNVNRGVVRYDPVSQDVAVPGLYYIKWKVNTPDQPAGYNQSYPEGGYETLVLIPST